MTLDSETNQKTPFVMSRLSRLEDCDRSFDVEFWQRQGAAAIFAAAWEMVVFAHELQGEDPKDLTFQNTLKKIKRSET